MKQTLQVKPFNTSNEISQWLSDLIESGSHIDHLIVLPTDSTSKHSVLVIGHQTAVPTGDQPVTQLPEGWTWEKQKTLPNLYRALGNLDKCLETLDLSRLNRNRDFAREILRQHGLWKEA